MARCISVPMTAPTAVNCGRATVPAAARPSCGISTLLRDRRLSAVSDERQRNLVLPGQRRYRRCRAVAIQWFRILPHGPTVTVTGGNEVNNVTINFTSPTNYTITRNGVTEAFSTTAYPTIIVDTGGGNDTLIVGLSTLADSARSITAAVRSLRATTRSASRASKRNICSAGRPTRPGSKTRWRTTCSGPCVVIRS